MGTPGGCRSRTTPSGRTAAPTAVPSASARPTSARTATRSNDNGNIRIANNQIIASGGTNLAGGIGIFNGADNYEIARNEICGNFSAEYGGGISHFGRSSGGRIHHNRIYFNASYDEGAGIMIAGQLPSPKNFPNLPVAAGRTHGSGAVTIDANVIQSNLSNDDGGGIRLLMAGVARSGSPTTRSSTTSRPTKVAGSRSTTRRT